LCKLGHFATYLCVNLTYLGQSNQNGVLSMEEGHCGLSFAKISEKNT